MDPPSAWFERDFSGAGFRGLLVGPDLEFPFEQFEDFRDGAWKENADGRIAKAGFAQWERRSGEHAPRSCEDLLAARAAIRGGEAARRHCREWIRFGF